VDARVGSENRLSDLETWLQKVEEMGELKRITAEVNPDLEISTVAYLSGKEIGSPALLFENITGHPGARALYNALGSSLTRICLAIREKPVDDPVELIKKLTHKMDTKIPPQVV
jgi:4-hydroxy-3-polyprenylbenzoate decarboxylase